MSVTPPPVADCDPPPTNPTPASTPLPPGSCDTHVHVFGPHARYALDPGRNYTPHECPLQDYRKVMRALGIARAVLVQPSVYGADNSAMLDALRLGGSAFRGIAVAAPEISDDELAEMHRLGVRGIRLNMINPQVVGLDQALSVLARVARWGWHLQVLLDLTHERGAGVLQSLCDRVSLPVVVDHMGKLPPVTRRHALFDLMKQGRCWVKLSAPYRISGEAPPHRDIAELARALADANPRQVLWGSDWPHTEQHHGTPQAASIAALFNEWFPDPSLRTQICVHNPARLYGYPQEFIA